MLSGIGIVCFASCYTIVLALEISRLLFRSAFRGTLMLGFAWAGFVAHTLFLFNQLLAFYQEGNPNASPLSSKQDWYVIAAWALVVLYLHLIYFYPKASSGLFVLPLILGLIGVAAFLADRQPFPREPASQVWGVIHGSSLLLATVAVLIGFAAGLMYLWQAQRLKQKVPAERGIRLPSLEWLQRTNSRAIFFALIMLGIGIFSGTILNLINRERDAPFVPWTDPVILSTSLMFGWLLVSTVASVFYRPAREGRRVAYLTMVSFVFLVIALSMVLFNDTQHGGVRKHRAETGANERVGLPRPSRVSHEAASGLARTGGLA